MGTAYAKSCKCEISESINRTASDQSEEAWDIWRRVEEEVKMKPHSLRDRDIVLSLVFLLGCSGEPERAVSRSVM